MDQETIKQLPKVELHCHLDGSIPLATLEKLAKKENIPLEQLESVTAPKKCLDLKEYLKSFDTILRLLQTEENLKQASYELIKNLGEENVCYIELRFAPLFHQQKGLSVEQVIRAVECGIGEAQKEVTIHVNLIVSAMRHHSEKQNKELIDAISKLNNEQVVGFDFAGDEQQVPNDLLKDCTDYALDSGLQLTLHAGECGCAQNVIEGIRLGATRIGHGVAIKEDFSIMKQVAQSNTLLEMCPTSNIQTNAIETWADYPLRLFLENEVKCCINTDNRTVSQTTLTNEYVLLSEHCQLSYQEMKELNLNAVNGSFASQQIKEEVKEKIEEGFAAVTR